jgi:hypothetical protein
VAAALLALLVSAGYMAAWPEAPVHIGDSPQYLAVADDLADFRLDTLHDRSPGYPLLLRIAGSTRLLFAVSLALHLVSVWLLVVLLRRADVPLRVRGAFAIVALLPPYVEPAGHLMTENLAQFSLCAGLAGLVFGWLNRRTWLTGLGGLAFGYAALTRPTYQALPVMLAACILIAAIPRPRHETWKHVGNTIAALCLGTMAALGPVIWVNATRFEYTGIVPTVGLHLSTKTMGFVERLPDEYAAAREILVRERDRQLIRRGGTHTGTQAIWSAREELSEATGLSGPELSSYLVRMNLTLIKRAPLEYFNEVARSFATYWFPPAGALVDMSGTPWRLVWTMLHVAVLALFFAQLVVLAGVWMLWLTRRAAGWHDAMRDMSMTRPQASMFLLAGTVVFYTMVLSCVVDIGEVRQRRPTDLFILFMCALGGWAWFEAARRSPRERRAAAAAAPARRPASR